MSIFEAMERLAGAALLALAPAAGVAVATQHRGRGVDLVSALRARGAGDLVDGYVGELTREIWVGAETRSLPQEALERHFADLAQIIAGYEVAEECLEGALSASAGGDRGRRIAVDLFLKARADGALEAHKLSDDVAMFVLERSFGRLVRERQRLTALAPMLKEFTGDGSTAVPPLHPELPIAPAVNEPRAATAPAPTAPAPAAPEKATSPRAPATPLTTEVAERARIRTQFDISEAAEARLLSLIESQGASGASRIARLEALARWIQEARAQLMRPTNDDGDLRKLKLRAADALAAGDLTLAMDTLKHIRRALRDGRRRIEARLEDEVAALKTQMTEEARAAARLAELAVARRDYLAAADLFVEAADCLPKSAREEAWRYHLARADALLRKADEEDDDAALGEALAGYGGVLKLLSDGSNAIGAARANVGVGRALHRQAEAATGTGRLGDAIVAFRKALGLISADDAPAVWCEAQAALARALMLSGQRTRQVPQLREAVEAYRTALDGASDDVATQIRLELNLGLGSALLDLAEFDKSPEVVEGAAAAYTDALAALSREEAPAAWAEASFNLGSALLMRADMRGEAGPDAERLTAAVEALGGAAGVMTPERDGDIWVNATLTLADALAALAETEKPSVERLRHAIATYRRVLEVVDRAATPITWATASMNLGSALIRLGEQEDKRNNWLAAAGAMVPALEVFEAEGATAHADLARRTLKRFHEEWVGLLAPQPSGPVAPPAASHLQQVG
jgi:tetratricopeptide (TPR) repeat protein